MTQREKLKRKKRQLTLTLPIKILIEIFKKNMEKSFRLKNNLLSIHHGISL